MQGGTKRGRDVKLSFRVEVISHIRPIPRSDPISLHCALCTVQYVIVICTSAIYFGSISLVLCNMCYTLWTVYLC